MRPSTGEGPFAISLAGIGQLATGDMTVFPDVLSLGGAPIGGSSVQSTLSFTNSGAASVTVTGHSVPAASTFFSCQRSARRTARCCIRANRWSATVTFQPKTAGVFSGNVTLNTNAPAPGAASVTVPVSASATPPAHLVFSAGTACTSARCASARRRSGSITARQPGRHRDDDHEVEAARGRSRIHARVAARRGHHHRRQSGFAVLRVNFKATTPGHFTDTWIVNGDDDTGLHTITFDAYAAPPSSSYWMVDSVGRVYPFGNAKAGHTSLLFGPHAVALDADTDRPRLLRARRPRPRAGCGRREGARQHRRGIAALRRARHDDVGDAVGSGLLDLHDARVTCSRTATRVPHGDLSSKALNGPIISSIATPTGLGYYMVGSDGGVFSFGDARFHGSTGGMRLNQPVVGLVPTASGKGYWLAAADGGVFAFGDAPFRGSMGGKHLNQPVIGMVRYGNGYLMVATDGGIFNFSSSKFVGSLGSFTLPAPIVGVGAFAA